MISAKSDIAFREFLLFRDRDIKLINIHVLVFITIDGYMFLESIESSVPFAAVRRTCTDISFFLRTRLSTVISV